MPSSFQAPPFPFKAGQTVIEGPPERLAFLSPVSGTKYPIQAESGDQKAYCAPVAPSTSRRRPVASSCVQSLLVPPSTSTVP